MLIIITTLTVLITLVGLVGAVVPGIPSSGLVLVAGLLQILVLGPEGGVGWWMIAFLAVGFVIAQSLDFLCGMLGAKKFGAGKWGMIGAMVGVIVGLFFGLPGLIIGPLVGALVFELIAGKELRAAANASWGTFIGTMLGMVFQAAITGTMAAVLIADIFLFSPLGQGQGPVPFPGTG